MHPPENNPKIAKRNAEVTFLLFALGGGMGLFSLHGTVPFGRGFEMYDLAVNLVKHGSYANPFLVLATGPSAVSPPLYPFFLALLMKFLRAPDVVLLAASLGNVLANAASAALLPRVSRLFFGSILPGVAASILWLLSVQLMPSWDASYTMALLLCFCIFTAATAGRPGFIVYGGLAGLLAGVLLLLNPMTLLVLGLWLVFLLFSLHAPLRRTAMYSLSVLAVAALMVFPWTYRNYRQLGGFVMRTSLGLTIYSANNDCARTSQFEEQLSGCYEVYHPNYSLTEAQTLRDMGELNYDRERLGDAKSWIRTHPEEFRRLTMARIFEFWLPRRVEHPFHATVIWIATILSIPGIAFMAYRREKVTVFIVSVLLVYPLTYYIVFSDIRFRYPILWLSFLPAGYFIQWLVQQAETKWRWKLPIDTLLPQKAE